MSIPSVPVRLDRAVDEVLGGRSAAAAAVASGLGAEHRALVEHAERLRDALPLPSVAPRFEARLGAKLAMPSVARDPVAWALRHPGRLIVTGAVGSAVGVGVTAYAVWRTRRATTTRLLHR